MMLKILAWLNLVLLIWLYAIVFRIYWILKPCINNRIKMVKQAMAKYEEEDG